MRGIVAAAFVTIIVVLGSAERAHAIGLCDCCASDLDQRCEKACAGQSKTAGQCTAVVDYAGKDGTRAGRNPLNGISLKNLSLGDPTAPQLESLRRLFERSRRRAIADYNRAAARLQRGRISDEAFAGVKALYREVLVNYYHGIHAYLNKIGIKPD